MSSLLSLNKIWGVGPKTADEFFKLGFHTIDDIRSRGMLLLNPQQTIGVRMYEEFQVRIPRSEVKEIEEFVRGYANELLPGVQVQLVTYSLPPSFIYSIIYSNICASSISFIL